VNKRGVAIRHCDECWYFNTDTSGVEAGCLKNLRARFYVPRGPMDQTWGWKRRCAEFLSRGGTPGAVK
jgi:hypothetical protein